MKYVLIGYHCSGKEEVIRDIKENTAIPVGKGFNNITTPIEGVYTCNADTYDNTTINEIFENQAYLFIREITDYDLPYYDGMSLSAFDGSAIVCLTPDQLVQIVKFPSEVCFVWLDNTAIERRMRYTAEKRKYDFNKAENVQREFTEDFINKIYNMPHSHVIYFNNEDPLRVSAVLQALIKHPDLLPIFEKRYN